MKNHSIAIIAFSLLFNISFLHACAGYTFHFNLPKTVSIPLDSYVSRMFPDDKRASIEYLDEIDKLKVAMDIKTPVFVMMKTSLGHDIVAQTQNVGWPYLRYSAIEISEEAFASHTSKGIPWANTHALAHELGHVKKNHQGILNALYSMRNTSIMKMLCTKCLDAKIESLDCRFNGTYVKTTRGTEYEAETEAVAALARCGYVNAIKARLENTTASVRSKILEVLEGGVLDDPYCNGSAKALSDYCCDVHALMHKTCAEIEIDIEKLLMPAQKECSFFDARYWNLKNDDLARAQHRRKRWASYLANVIDFELNRERPHGYIYPTAKEMIAYQSKGLTECLESSSIDPRTTQDTPNLMRNGSQPQ